MRREGGGRMRVTTDRTHSAATAPGRVVSAAEGGETGLLARAAGEAWVAAAAGAVAGSVEVVFAAAASGGEVLLRRK